MSTSAVNKLIVIEDVPSPEVSEVIVPPETDQIKSVALLPPVVVIVIPVSPAHTVGTADKLYPDGRGDTVAVRMLELAVD